MVKIYVMTHKRFTKPDDDIYIPLHVGRAKAEDLSYLGDNTGDNISALNCYYGELTGMYWIWKNETDADFVGICHYRRYFLNESGEILTSAEFEDILKNCDVMVSEMLGGTENNWTNYAAYHNAADMEAVGEAIKKIFPSDYEAFRSVLSDTKCCYGNLMVTTLEKYREYCAWLFPVLEEAGKTIDVTKYNAYHKRVFGFLSEILLYVWITARRYSIHEGRIGVTSEKAETIEFKHEIESLVKQGKILQAKKLFYTTMQDRPDLRLDLSDIKQEIPVIEKILYIMNQEQKSGETGLIGLSRDFTVLTEHYKNSYHLIAKYGKNARETAKKYFEVFTLSDSAYHIIEQDVNGRLSYYHYLNEGEPAKKISVIVPVIHYSNELSAGIANLVNQTMEDLAVIFIDLCGKEEIKHILQDCMQQYPKKVQVFLAEEWNEQIESIEMRERGIGMEEEQAAALDSEYLIFVRADDLSDTSMCEKLFQGAEENGWKLTGGKYIDSRTDSVKFMLPADRMNLSGQSCMFWGCLIQGGLWREKVQEFKVQDGCLSINKAMASWAAQENMTGNIDDLIYRYSG